MPAARPSGDRGPMTQPSTTTTPLETIQAVYAAFAAGDVPGLLALVDEDVDWGRAVQAPGGEVVPHLRHGIGMATPVAYFTAVGETMELHSFAPRRFFADGDDVV